jgi:hypothetical protein
MSGILSDNDLGNLRTVLSGLLPDRCSIRRTTETDDALGGQTVAETEIATNVPCLVVATRGRQQVGLAYDMRGTVGRLAEEGDYQITLPFEADVVIGDFIVLTPQLSTTQLRLRIVALVEGESLEVVKQAGGMVVKED